MTHWAAAVKKVRQQSAASGLRKEKTFFKVDFVFNEFNRVGCKELYAV